MHIGSSGKKDIMGKKPYFNPTCPPVNFSIDLKVRTQSSKISTLDLEYLLAFTKMQTSLKTKLLSTKTLTWSSKSFTHFKRHIISIYVLHDDRKLVPFKTHDVRNWLSTSVLAPPIFTDLTSKLQRMSWHHHNV